MASRRDYQRSRIYAAERQAFQGGEAASIVTDTGSGPAWGGFGEPIDPVLSMYTDEIQDFVNKVFASKYVRKKWGSWVPCSEDEVTIGFLFTPRVRDARRNAARGWCCWRDETINLPPYRYNRRISYVIHEISHFIQYPHDGWFNHGPTFAMVYQDLVRRYMGKDAAKELRRAFRDNKVRVATGLAA